MRYDITPSLVVPAAYRRIYTVLRGVVACGMIAVGAWILMLVVFPSATGAFNFRAYYGAGNTLISPRGSDGTLAEGGKIAAGQALVFNMVAEGSFSYVDVTASTREESALDGWRVEIMRSYRSALLPDGKAVSWPDGVFLRVGERYYLVSNSTLRAFSSVADVQRLGYDPAQARAVSDDDVALMPRGDDLTATEGLPQGATVLREGSYYHIGERKELIPFVSERAYRTRFDNGDAAQPREDLLETYQRITDRMIGFADGTLLAYGEAAYAVEGDMLRPIVSPEVFLAKGYAWDAILTATGEEFGMYTRGKSYLITTQHPVGTMLYDSDRSLMYRVGDTEKYPVNSRALMEYYLRPERPRPISFDAERIQTSCILAQQSLTNAYACTVDYAPLVRGVGREYQFTLIPPKEQGMQNPVTFSTARVAFVRDVNQANFNGFLAELSQRVRARYGGTL